MDEASCVCSVSNVTYARLRESNPGAFRLRELRCLYAAMTDTSKDILLKAIRDFVCG